MNIIADSKLRGNVTQSGSDAITMTSLDFLNDIINPARADEGESPLRNTELLRKLEDECDDLPVADYLQPPKGGTPQKYYLLNFDQMMLIGMRESKAVRRSVLVRLKALEVQTHTPQPDPMVVLNDPATMRGLLLTYSEKVLALEERVGEMAPVVQAFGRIATAEGSLNLTEAAKVLQVPPRKLTAHLQAARWIYKRPGARHWLGYQDKVQQGLLEHKLNTYQKGDGSEGLSEQVRILPKGITKLAQSLSIGGVQ
ncbi:phage antirepressor KilAC domain-containing protein [Aeromonas caviae]|uniref:phage antirepressor KilAC domain-containing protein n=1 Tax=Aeromonas caviae TaxID=648 RepID=UPI003F744800